MSSADVRRLPTTTSTQEVHSRSSTYEEIADLITSDKEAMDTCTSIQPEQQYNKISSQPYTQPLQVYTSIIAAYEYVSYPDA